MSIFGISGETISLIVQILALIGCFAVGVSGYRKKLLPIALVIGVSANILGQIIFAGGGPGAFVGMVIIPLYCLVTSYLGRATWWAILGRHRQPHLCHRCGNAVAFEHPTSSCPKCGELSRCVKCHYSLEGNVTGRCPECGHQFKTEEATTSAARQIDAPNVVQPSTPQNPKIASRRTRAKRR